MNILEKIIHHKRLEIVQSKRHKPLSMLKSRISRKKKTPFRFKRALMNNAAQQRPFDMAVIAEIKRKSPSRGILKANFQPAKLAKAYQAGGARALSILTDKKFFGGSLKHIAMARKVTRLPILRKDFIIDPYQIYESSLAGADAILLIASVLTSSQIKHLQRRAMSLGLDVLLEVHSVKDLAKISDGVMVGINNRNLKTFKVSLNTTKRLMKHIKRRAFVVSESGIKHHSDLLKLKRMGVRAVLVGENLIRQKNTQKALSKLMGRS